MKRLTDDDRLDATAASEISHPDAIMTAAEHLAASPHRYIEGHQLGAIRTKFKLSKDDARRACIVADRLRRLRQIEQHGTGFKMANLVEPDAPIVLPIKPRKR